MRTKERITVESLHAEYAGRIAAVVGLDVTEYDVTANGLASLLRDATVRLSALDPNVDVLDELANYLDAAELLGSSPGQRVLEVIGNTLSEAVPELERG